MMTSDLQNSESVISRITSVFLKNFRGFRGEHTLNTDADLVLITGPNGYGKTSLLDALLLLLSGWHAYPKPEKLVSLLSKSSDGTVNKKAKSTTDAELCECFALRATCKLDDKPESNLNLRLKYNSKGEVEGSDKDKKYPLRPANLPLSRLTHEPALHARLCAFSQERVQDLFDETTRGTTIRDVFEPLPVWLSMSADFLKSEDGQNGEAQQKLQSKLSELEKKWQEKEQTLKRKLSSRSRDKLLQTLKEALEAFAPLYRELVNSLTNWPKLPAEATNTALTAFALQVLKAKGTRAPREGEEQTDPALPDNFRRDLIGENGELRSQLRAALRAASEATPRTVEIRQQIDRVQSELKQIDQEYPNLERDLAAFDAVDSGLPDALAVFQVLAGNAARWAGVIASSGSIEADHLTRIVEELATVDLQEAGKCAQIMDTWLTPRREAMKRRKALIIEHDRLQQALRVSLSSEEIKRLRACVETNLSKN